MCAGLTGALHVCDDRVEMLWIGFLFRRPVLPGRALPRELQQRMEYCLLSLRIVVQPSVVRDWRHLRFAFQSQGRECHLRVLGSVENVHVTHTDWFTILFATDM